MAQIIDATHLSLSAQESRYQAAAHAYPAAPPCATSLSAHLGQELLGVTLLLLGGALTLTLWLMPIGAPLALLGIGLMSAPNH